MRKGGGAAQLSGMRIDRLWLAAASALVLTLASLAAAVAQAEPVRWPQEASDLKPDPAIRFSRLPNGMTYAIMPNKTPPGEASVRLRIDAGSLDEAETELGIAHFLEHMAFNGSKNVPEGEMKRTLERAGLAFGPDTNAYTGFTETVYMLDLPETDGKTLDTGLFLMRELAGNLSFAADAVDRERGVILSEERARDTPGLRVLRDRLGFVLEGQQLPQRFPIGDTAIIKAAPRERFVDFYKRHYRPDQATLVIVGDVDPAATEALVRAKFGDWTAEGAAPADPEAGVIAVRRPFETRLKVEPGTSLSLQLTWTAPPDLAPDTRAKRTGDLPESVGFAVLNRRFARLARQASPPFIAASGGRATESDVADLTTVAVTAEPGRWREALQAAETEQRRLVQHGVLQSEVDREVAEWRAALTARVAGAATRRNRDLAATIVSGVDSDEVVTSPQTDLELFEAGAKGLTAERVSAAVRAAFKGQGPLLYVASPTPIEGGEQALAAAVERSRALAVAAPTAEVAKTWPYADWGKPGVVAERRETADLGTSFVRFVNGVKLTVKPTKLEDDEVLVSVRVGRGRLDLPVDRETEAWAAPFAVADGGTVELDNEEIDRILTGKVVGSAFSIDEDAFVFSGKTRPEDFGVQLELLTAQVQRPGFRPEPFLRMRAFGGTLHEQYEATPNGVLSRDLGALVRADDPRWRFPTREEIAAAQPEALKALLAGPLSQGAIEVTIVGDVSVEDAVAQTARTFGALPARPGQGQAARERLAVSFPKPAAAPVALTHRGRPDQAIAYAAWPTLDFFSDPRKARELRLLESVLDLRLNDELREKQGATYSPFTQFASSLTYPGYGYVAAGMETPPDRLPAFFTDIRRIAKELREQPVTPDELDRARRPRIEAIQRARATNEYWLGQLSGAWDDPRRLEAIRTHIPDLEQATPAVLQALARAYLTDEREWTLKVTPAPVAAAAREGPGKPAA